jgi:hypothetical protein
VPRIQLPDYVYKITILDPAAGTEGSKPGLSAARHAESEVPAARVAGNRVKSIEKHHQER